VEAKNLDVMVLRGGTVRGVSWRTAQDGSLAEAVSDAERAIDRRFLFREIEGDSTEVRRLIAAYGPPHLQVTILKPCNQNRAAPERSSNPSFGRLWTKLS
jgi:hypothetical protein